MKKILVFFSILILVLLPLFNNFDAPKIEIVSTTLTMEEDLQAKTEENLKLFDFSTLDDELKKLEANGEFGASTFLEKVKQLINDF